MSDVLDDVLAPTPADGVAVDGMFSFLGFGKKPSPEEQARRAAQKDHKARTKEAEAEHKQDVKRSKAEIDYRDVLADVKDARNALEPFRPVSDGDCDKLDKAMTEADGLVRVQAPAKPDYAGAAKALGKLKLEDMLKTAESGFDKGHDKAAKAFPHLFRMQEEYEKEVEAARGFLTDKEWADALASYREATAPLAAKPADPAVANAAQVALGKAHDNVQDILDDARANLEDARDARKRAEDAIKAARAVLAPDQLALPEERFKAGQALLDGKDLVAAHDAFAEAAAAATDGVDADMKARADWAKLQPKLEGLALKAGTHAQWFTRHADGALLDARKNLADATADLKSLVDNPPGKGDGPARSFTSAVKLARQVGDQLDVIGVQVDGYKQFSDARHDARDKVRAAADRAEVVIKHTRTVIDEAEDLDNRSDSGYVPGTHKLVDGLQDRLDKARETWRKRYKDAADEASLRADEAVSCMNAIAAEAEALADDPKKLARALKRSATVSARDRLAGAMADAEAKLDDLALRDIDRALELQERLAKYRQRGGAAESGREVDRLCRSVEEIGDKATAAMKPQKGDFTNGKDETWRAARRDELEERIAKLDAALKRSWAKIEKVSNNKERDGLAKQHDLYAGMLDGARAMAKEDQAPVLVQCAIEMTELEELVADLDENFGFAKAKRTIRSVLPGAPDSTAMAELQSRIDSLLKRTGQSKDTKIFAGDTVFELQTQLEALKKSLGSETPAKVAEKLDAIEKKLGEAKETAAEGRKAYNALKKDIEAAKKALDGSEVFKLVPALRAQLEKELDEVRSASRQPGGPTQALLDTLAELRGRIDRPGIRADGTQGAVSARGVPESMEREERDLVADRRAFEVKKAVWDKKAELLRDQIKAMPGDGDRAKSLLKRLADAGKGYRSNEDEGTTEALTEAIRLQVERVEQNPEGLKVHARNRLPQVRQRWKDAVTGFRGAVAGLASTVGGLDDPDLDDAGRTAAATAVTRVNALFNGAVFDRALGEILEEGVTDAEAAKSREDALKELRRLLAIVEGDQRLVVMCRRTSFSDGLGPAVSELRLSLADLEQNLLVSL